MLQFIFRLYCIKVRIITDKYIKVGYPFDFINSIIDGFNQEKEYLLIPTSLFEKR